MRRLAQIYYRAGVTQKVERRELLIRRWLAVFLASVLMLMDSVMFLFGFASSGGDETVFGGGVIGIALGLVPGVFVVAAFVSLQPRAIRTALLSTALWILVTIPIAIFDLPLALVAGFGVGGIFAFRLGVDHTRQSRAVAVGVVVVYTFVLQQISPAAGILGGAALPFFAIGVADSLRDRRVDEEPTATP